MIKKAKPIAIMRFTKGKQGKGEITTNGFSYNSILAERESYEEVINDLKSDLRSEKARQLKWEARLRLEYEEESRLLRNSIAKEIIRILHMSPMIERGETFECLAKELRE